MSQWEHQIGYIILLAFLNEGHIKSVKLLVILLE